MFYVVFYPLVYAIIRTIIWTCGRVYSTGRANVPKTGGVIYSANHVSDADPPTLFVTVPRRAWYLGKSELFPAGFQGWFFKQFRGVPIQRDSADRAALRVAERILTNGSPLVVFPEGRCSQSGKLARLQPGAALLSLRTGCPIVPIGLINTNKILPYGTGIPRIINERVTVNFGAPIFPSEFESLPRSQAIEAITNRLSIEIAKLSDQPPPIISSEKHRKKRLQESEATNSVVDSST